MATEAMTKHSRLALDLQPPIARISVSNPPVNVIDIPMMEQLVQAVAEVESDRRISVLVFSGAGRSFSAGVDMAAHTPDKVREMLTKFHAVIRAVVASKKVTIAAVHGNCLGGGAELAMVCDLVYTTERAQWGFPEIKLGCYPPVAATALAALVGQKRAADLILTGRSIVGSEAASIGLANRAVLEAELDQVVQETLDHLVKLSPAALAVAKNAFYGWDSMHFDKGLARAERIYFEELMQMEDAKEGISAFLEKREPRWNSR